MNNREIKFRIWDGKKIIYTDTPRRVMNDSGGHPYLPFYLHQHTFDNKNIVIEQFTGLKDSKGKEIYEGDIVKHCWLDHPDSEIARIGVVSNHFGEYLIISPDFYKENGYIITARHSGNCWYQTTLKSMFQSVPNHQFKVIGNIHENPELLK